MWSCSEPGGQAARVTAIGPNSTWPGPADFQPPQKSKLGGGTGLYCGEQDMFVFLIDPLGWAEVEGSRDLFIGVNALDYSGYPDCRPEFVDGFEKLARLATKAGTEGRAFTIHAPLQHMTKADIAREAQRLGLDAALSHSCYDPQGDGSHCGLCDACRLRAKGFAEAGLVDPTRYAVHADSD